MLDKLELHTFLAKPRRLAINKTKIASNNKIIKTIRISNCLAQWQLVQGMVKLLLPVPIHVLESTQIDLWPWYQSAYNTRIMKKPPFAQLYSHAPENCRLHRNQNVALRF